MVNFATLERRTNRQMSVVVLHGPVLSDRICFAHVIKLSQIPLRIYKVIASRLEAILSRFCSSLDSIGNLRSLCVILEESSLLMHPSVQFA